MKRRKTYIYSLITLFILIWFFSGFVNIETKNNPIKKITKTNVLYLFGKKSIWSFHKTVEHYNKTGQKTKEEWYNGDRIHRSYIYEYTEFDSIKRRTWLARNKTLPQGLTDYKYDDENRLTEIIESSIDRETKAMRVYDKDYFYYDSLGRNYKTEMKHIGKESIGTTTFIEFYTPQNKLNTRIHISFDSSEYITTYKYDSNGYSLNEFGGFTNDSIYYKTNEKGQITEEITKKYFPEKNEYYYDKKGNKIKTILDVDNLHHQYDFIYDKNNRITKELRPWTLFGLIRGGVKYDFNYYLE